MPAGQDGATESSYAGERGSAPATGRVSEKVCPGRTHGACGAAPQAGSRSDVVRARRLTGAEPRVTAAGWAFHETLGRSVVVFHETLTPSASARCMNRLRSSATNIPTRWELRREVGA